MKKPQRETEASEPAYSALVPGSQADFTATLLRFVKAVRKHRHPERDMRAARP